MSTFRYDFVFRAIQQATGAAVQVAAGRRTRSYEASLERLREACVEALGMELDVLTRFDAGSVARLFSSPEHIHSLALLLEEKAALLQAHGREEEALVESVFATQLTDESRRRYRARDVQAAGRLRTSLARELVRF